MPVREKRRGQVSLLELKHIVSQQTSIPVEQIKLIFRGLILKDDRQPLVAFGLYDNARLGLIGTSGGVPVTGDRPGNKSSVLENGQAGLKRGGVLSKGEEIARKKAEREQDFSEHTLLTRIEETVENVRKTLLPEVEEFEHTGNGKKQSDTSHESPIAKQQRKLSELLLRALLALDDISVNSDETRKRRKDAVKEVQSYLDRVDGAWQSIKAK